jgi:hypothetical protein
MNRVIILQLYKINAPLCVAETESLKMHIERWMDREQQMPDGHLSTEGIVSYQPATTGRDP